MSSYDQNLLDEAPRATRAQLQEGYNVDLLEPPPPRRNPTPQIPQPAPVTVPLTPGVAETGPEEKFASPAYTSAAPTSKPSFWRSRNGVITVVVITLIVIGVVVGGAVGGTVKKSNNSNVATAGTHTTSSSDTSLPISSLPVATTDSASLGQPIGANPTSRSFVPTSTADGAGSSSTRTQAVAT